MFLVSLAWLNAYSMVLYGLSRVPEFSLLPSVETTRSLEASITLISSSASPGLAVRSTVPTMEGGVNLAVASLDMIVTEAGSMVPSLTCKSSSYSGIESSRANVCSPSVPMNFTPISAVVPMYTGSLLQLKSTMVQNGA